MDFFNYFSDQTLLRRPLGNEWDDRGIWESTIYVSLGQTSWHFMHISPTQSPDLNHQEAIVK